MIREIIAVTAMIALSVLIIYKGDKQFIHILEGGLFKQNRDTIIAAKIYRYNTKFSAVISFSLGGAAMGIAIILFSNGNEFFLIPAAMGLVLLGIGVWSRIRSFRITCRELGIP